MTPRERSSLFADLCFAYTQLDSGISLVKRGQFGLASEYITSAEHEYKILHNKLRKIQ